jgi:hypothetical protein
VAAVAGGLFGQRALLLVRLPRPQAHVALGEPARGSEEGEALGGTTDEEP